MTRSTQTQPEALALAQEYRVTMTEDVLHSWAADARDTLCRLHARVTELEATLPVGQDADGSVIRWVANGVIGARPTTHDLREAIESAEDSLQCNCDDCTKAQQESSTPVAWYVTGCSTMLDEHDAKVEAKRCGGSARAVPLYTRDLRSTS